jgi:hypothetical protein
MRNDKKTQSQAGKNPDPSRFVSASQLARMCSVSRQYIFKLIKGERLKLTAGGYIDLQSEEAILLVESKKDQMKPAHSSQIPKGFMIVDDEEGPDGTDAADEDEPSQAQRDDLLSLQKRKLRAEIVKKELEIAVIEGSVLDERIVISLIGELGQGIRLNFIDVCLRQSEQLCAMLGVPGREREVQEYLEVR